MGIPYRARVNERWFLNLPGFHGGAYVVAYVEDTSERGPRPSRYRYEEPDRLHNFEPRIILEIADCDRRINLEFDIGSEAERANSLHKVDTLIAALRVFRTGIEQEFEHYDRRERDLDETEISAVGAEHTGARPSRAWPRGSVQSRGRPGGASGTGYA